jgi:hypothetical protein
MTAGHAARVIKETAVIATGQEAARNIVKPIHVIAPPMVVIPAIQEIRETPAELKALIGTQTSRGSTCTRQS